MERCDKRKMKQDVEIKDFEDRQTDQGKAFTIFETDSGRYSCWDSDFSSEIKKCVGKLVSIEVQESKDGAFKNIRGFYGLSPHKKDLSHEQEIPVEGTIKISGGENGDRYKSMYVSYAKDIFVALWTAPSDDDISEKRTMERAIDLVKQAKESF